MTMMLIGGAIVCSWVFMRLLTNERARSAWEAEAAVKSASAHAENRLQADPAGHSEKLTRAASPTKV
ncbi:hypothetical protein BH09PLA1_BH09PLA1_29930 [soil metagenome]